MFPVLAAAAVSADVWPQAPPAPESAEGGGPRIEISAEYRYAAGLYRALAETLGQGNPSLLAREDLQRLLRAWLAQGEGERARAFAADRDDLSRELALQIALAGDPLGWSDLERERWEAAFQGGDGESLYWRGRIALALGRSDEARRHFADLLRREPGSIFAPAALEQMQGLPEHRPVAADPSVAENPGPRVQWGVFRETRGARRLRDAVEAYGQEAELIRFRREGAELYRVCSPPLGDEAEARTLGEHLKTRYGLDYVLLRPAAERKTP